MSEPSGKAPACARGASRGVARLVSGLFCALTAWLGLAGPAAAEAALQPTIAKFGDKVSLNTKSGIAKLSVVGIGMRSHSGVAAHMFEALAEAGINIQMISTSEIKTAVTIREEKIDEAARVVHSAFGLDNEIANETAAAS